MELKLFPAPKNAEFTGGICAIPQNAVFLFENKKTEMFRIVESFVAKYSDECGKTLYPVPDFAGRLVPFIQLKFDETKKEEEYSISVKKNGITILCGTDEGAFRAMTSFVQLAASYRCNIPCVEIQDAPSYVKRGFMLDISRGKVPKLSEVLELIDLLADLKYNELQLYIENFSYQFVNFPQYFNDIKAYSPFDIMKIVDYCRKKYITVIPNQNSFGHMYSWVSKKEFRDVQIMRGDFCINPAVPESIKLIGEIYDSLIPSYDSDYINVGCDEVGSIHTGKCRALCNEIGAENVYMKHILEIADELKKRGKKMMMWADMLLSYESAVERLPSDVIPLVWGYCYDTNFERPCKKMEKTGLKYYVCPGTSGWGTLTGDGDNTLGNVETALDEGYTHGAYGALLTDWGDLGHSQMPLVSHAPIAFFAAKSWNIKTEKSFSQSCEYLDKFFYRCEKGSFANLLVDISNVTHKYGNLTPEFYCLLLPFDNKDVIKDATCESIEEAVSAYDKLLSVLPSVKMSKKDADLLKKEITCNVKMDILLLDLEHIRCEIRDFKKCDNQAKRMRLLKNHQSAIEKEFISLWNERNYSTGNRIYNRWVRKEIRKADAATSQK